MNPSITIARGDGIGPEIMDAVLRILDAANVSLHYDEVVIGKQAYSEGCLTGISEQAWDTVFKNKVMLKSPITTPQGGGYKSLNVCMRSQLGLYANVRPCVAYAPYVPTHHPALDVVIVRENSEDLYTGLEYRLSNEVYESLKLMSESGCERIIRFAFEYARRFGRQKVTCVSKDNIMKWTDGLFHKVFDRVKTEYAELETDHYIVDIGMARAATQPERFDVIVLPNLYGDIMSDVIAEISGSVGLAGSANIGEHFAMFEAIHGSAPDIAGQDIANPSGLLLAAVQMLVHLGLGDAASHIHNAWLATIESGVHTADIYTPENSRDKVGTQAFSRAVIDRLGSTPSTFSPKRYDSGSPIAVTVSPISEYAKSVHGVDVFIQDARRNTDDLLAALQAVPVSDLSLRFSLLANGGTKVWPDLSRHALLTDLWRCRFERAGDDYLALTQITELLRRLVDQGLFVVKTETLLSVNGQACFSE